MTCAAQGSLAKKAGKDQRCTMTVRPPQATSGYLVPKNEFTNSAQSDDENDAIRQSS